MLWDYGWYWLSMAITVQSRQTETRSDQDQEAAGGQEKEAGGSHMLHTTPAPSMPARTQGPGAAGGQAILASSQHSSWHHQASEYPHPHHYPHPHVIDNKDPSQHYPTIQAIIYTDAKTEQYSQWSKYSCCSVCFMNTNKIALKLKSLKLYGV